MDDRAAIVVLLHQRLDLLLAAMPAAQAGDARSVHRARVATRRLRAALPVLRQSLDEPALGRRAEDRVRRLTRALGPVRELDVALQQLEQFSGRLVVSARGLTRVRSALAAERLERRRRMLAEITPGKVDKLRHQLARLRPALPATGTPDAVCRAAQRAARRAGRLRAAVERAGSIYLADRLHAVRVAAKKLRYAMEIERELKRSRATARIRQLKDLQDLLGQMHDLEVLARQVRTVQADTVSDDRRLSTELEGLLTAIEEDCRQLHASYMRRRAAVLRLCASVESTDRPSRAVA